MSARNADTLEIRLSVELGSPAAKVWQPTGNFNGLPDWNPRVESSALEPADGGIGRRVVIFGGAAGRRELHERLVYFDAAAHEYAYTIVGGAAPPFVDYVGHVRVVPRGPDRCTFEFHARFRAAPGASDDVAREWIRTFYDAGLANLKRLFGP